MAWGVELHGSRAGGGDDIIRESPNKIFDVHFLT